jgi:hypothetical protein
MALFLQNVSSDRIMILGRWESEAFLVYIRPQVLEWTNNMSKSMIAIDSFTDIGNTFTPNERRPNRAPHTTSMAPHLSSSPVFTSGTERVQWFLIHSRSAVWIAEFLTRKPQTNLLPY